MSPARESLLRTFASVPPSARVLDLGTGAAADLARLGFDLWVSSLSPEATRRSVAAVLGEVDAAQRVAAAQPEALGYPDAHFDWVALALPAADDGEAVLREVRRVMRPGAWVWIVAEALTPDALAALAEAAGLAVAEQGVPEGEGARGIFRRVEAGVRG